MEFVPSDDRAVRRLARELRAELRLRGVERDLDACLGTLAEAYGFDGPGSLHARLRRGKPSPMDDEAETETVECRRALQKRVLAALGLPVVDVEEMLDSLRLTARRHARGPGSRSLVGMLDVPHDLCEPLGDERLPVMAELVARERGLEAMRATGGSGSGSPADIFARAQPGGGGVWRHFREGRYEASLAVTLLLDRISRSEEERILWVAALREMWRRVGGGCIGIGHFAEAFSCGIPGEAAARAIWARRRSGERTTGFPSYSHAVPQGGVGFMLSRTGEAPRVLVVPDLDASGFMERHAAMLRGAPGDPAADLEANLGLAAELVREVGRLPEGHPDERLAMGLLLWGALVRPDAGEGTLARIREGGRRHLTMTVTAEGRVGTSLAAAFEDRTRMPFG